MAAFLPLLLLLAGPAVPLNVHQAFAASSGSSAAGSAGSAPESAAIGVAVVELFTSEGCSSCPPADRLLADLAAEAEKAELPVFALSFHVDYWDYLGWADPFARAGYSLRQKSYAEALGGGVYTPEMVVNGRQGFVGSKEAHARRAVRAALARPAPVRFVRLEAEPRDGTVRVAFSARGIGPGVAVNMALVRADTAVRVKRGENGGRTLRHRNVVRAFATARPDPSGAGERNLPWPPGSRAGDWTVIAYAQDAESLAVLGAARTALSGATGSGSRPSPEERSRSKAGN